MAAASGWYVIQVQSGREEALCALLMRVGLADSELGEEPLIEECFCPKFTTRRKYRGEWQDVTRLLLPGYVIAVSRQPEELAVRLRTIPKFTHLLTMGDEFVPLRKEERAWIEESTHKGDRTMAMSIAYKSGDSIVVTSGPLKGREAMITKVNRRKCLAYLELSVGGKRVTSVVGLGILPSEPEQKQA